MHYKSFFIECAEKVRDELIDSKSEINQETASPLIKSLFDQFSDDEHEAIMLLLLNGPDTEYHIQRSTIAAFRALKASRTNISIDEFHLHMNDYLQNLFKRMGGSGTVNEEGHNEYSILFADGTEIEFEPYINESGKPKLRITTTQGHMPL